MSAKRSRHVRRFLTAADARMADASFLRTARRTLAAVYLAGYAVEFVLKALLIGQLPEHDQLVMIDRFRGSVAHDYGWIMAIYRRHGGAPTPLPVTRSLVVLQSWGTDLRYNPRVAFPGDVDQFFVAVETVMAWARGRL